MNSEFDGRRSDLGRKAMTEVRQEQWSHPQASRNKIRQALEEQLGRVQAHLKDA